MHPPAERSVLPPERRVGTADPEHRLAQRAQQMTGGQLTDRDFWTRSPTRPARSGLVIDMLPPELPNDPAPSIVRSFASVVNATPQPEPTSSSLFSSGTTASVRKTSLKIERPVISRIGRISMPG